MFFFFKQKTAYEMRISDWSSDVCSSDLAPCRRARRDEPDSAHPRRCPHGGLAAALCSDRLDHRRLPADRAANRGDLADPARFRLPDPGGMAAAEARNVVGDDGAPARTDRKSTRLNSSH